MLKALPAVKVFKNLLVWEKDVLRMVVAGKDVQKESESMERMAMKKKIEVEGGESKNYEIICMVTVMNFMFSVGKGNSVWLLISV